MAMKIEPKVGDAFGSYKTGVSGAKNAGVDDKYLAVMTKISSYEANAKQQANQYDVAADTMMDSGKMDPSQLSTAWTNLEGAYNGFNAWLKKFRGLLNGAVDKGKTLPANYKQYYLRPMDILVKELDSMSNAMKIDLKAEEAKVAKLRGQNATAGEAKKRVLEDLHLRVRKGCDDAEANVKKFLLKPSEASFMAAFSSGQAFRTLDTSKQFVQKMGPSFGKEDWYGKLLKLYGDLKPEGIREVGQQKNSTYWEGKYKKFARDGNWWNTTQARVEAQRLMTKELPRWRKFAADVKTLYKP